MSELVEVGNTTLENALFHLETAVWALLLPPQTKLINKDNNPFYSYWWK